MRALAERHSAEIQQATQRGENPYQVSLDQADKLKAYAALLSMQDGTAFSSMYAEEVEALTAMTKARTARIIAESARPQPLGEQLVHALIAVIIFAILLGTFLGTRQQL